MSRRSVLIVDDNVEFRRLARRLLEHGGYDVVGEAGDAATALRDHALLQPEIVLLDVQLPDRDGFAVAEILAVDTPPPIIVLISSRDRGAYRIKLARHLRPRVPAQRRTVAADLRPGGQRVNALDIGVGVGYLLAALSLRRSPKLALLAAATGVLWFAGDLLAPLLFAHRAPLTHLLLLYPLRAFRSKIRLWTVCAVYAASLLYPIAQQGLVTTTLFLAVLAAAVIDRPSTPVAERRSTRLASAGAVLVWGLLVGAVIARWAGAQLDAVLLIDLPGRAARRRGSHRDRRPGTAGRARRSLPTSPSTSGRPEQGPCATSSPRRSVTRRSSSGYATLRDSPMRTVTKWSSPRRPVTS